MFIENVHEENANHPDLSLNINYLERHIKESKDFVRL